VTRASYTFVMPGLVRASTSFLPIASQDVEWPGAQTSVRSLRKADYYARP